MSIKTASLFISVLFSVTYFVSPTNAQTDDRPATKLKIVSVPNSSMQLEGEVKTVNGITFVRVYHEIIEVQNVADQTRSTLDLLAIHDPATHFVFWHVERDMNTNNLAEWCNRLWSVPDVGLIRVSGTGRGIVMEIYKTQAIDFDEWKTSMMEELAKQFGQGLTLPANEELRVDLEESLGGDFFVRPGVVSASPPAKVVSVKYYPDGWEVELRSGVKVANAVIYLNPAFKVLRAFRNDKQVYEMASNLSKNNDFRF